MKDSIILKSYEVLNDMILLKWDDETESFLHLKKMRKIVPALIALVRKMFCNIYKGPKQVFTEDSYVLNGMQPVGYYALRPFWADGHHSGIYSFTLMKKSIKRLNKLIRLI